jgi:hypothetical protein
MYEVHLFCNTGTYYGGYYLTFLPFSYPSCHIILLFPALHQTFRFCKPSLTKKYGSILGNPPVGDGHRNGAVRKRSQTFNPKTQQYVKRDTETGKFIDVKQDGNKFKGIRTEKQ